MVPLRTGRVLKRRPPQRVSDVWVCWANGTESSWAKLEMIFQETKLARVFEIALEFNSDERGFFARSWCQKEFERHGLNPKVVQCNVSFNARRGNVARHPLPGRTVSRSQTGALFQRIDLRCGCRPAAGVNNIQRLDRSCSDGRERDMVYVPEGCAHGFLTLEDETEVFYQMSEFYHAELSRGVRLMIRYFKSLGQTK